MKSGAITSICVVCLLLVAFSGCAEEEILFVNDSAWEVIEGSDEEMLVPLVEAGARFGIEIEHRSTELLEFRWDFYRDVYSVERFPVVNGRIMADVLWLADLVGADVHRIGERTYIETVRPALTEIEAENDGVALRFNGFTPSTITIDDQGESVRIVLHHCTLEVDPQLILLPDGVVSRVRLSATPGGGEVLIQLRKPSSSGVRRQIEEDFFSLAVSFTADERRDTITRLGTGIALHEITLPQTHGLLRVDVLRVDDWRDNYRMRAVVPAFGLDRPVPLAELARGSGADVAIDVSLWDADGRVTGGLVSHGMPYRESQTSEPLLTVDLFGRLQLLETQCSAQLEISGEPVAIDGINRPLSYGQVVVYPPGYGSDIARGVPGSFCVIKIRDRRVVSLYDGPFVSPDPTATLVVASGDARARIAWVGLGDTARLTASLGSPTAPSAVDAVACGGLVAPEHGVISSSDGPGTGQPRAWTLLGQDWYGNLLLVVIHADETSVGVAPDRLAGVVLRLLDTQPNLLVSLGAAESAGLVYRDERGIHGVPETSSSVTALCLIRRTP